MRRLGEVAEAMLDRGELPGLIVCLERAGPFLRGERLAWDERLLCYRNGDRCAQAWKVREGWQTLFAAADWKQEADRVRGVVTAETGERVEVSL